MKAIDLFAGAGGFTAGALAAGADVVWAANHNPAAIEVHAKNHPNVQHVCQDLHQANWYALPQFDLLLASPACQGHSTASQPKRLPKHDDDRSTAWAVTACAEVCRPKAIIVENVPRFTRWVLFENWCGTLEKLGYSLTVNTVNAYDYGAPQDRYRVVITGIHEGPAHQLRKSRCKKMVCGDILDPDAGGWRPVKSKPRGVQARVAKGRARHGHTFLTQHTTDNPGRALTGPMATVTTVPGHWNLVRGDMMRTLKVRELARAQTFKDSFWLPQNTEVGTRLVGNAIPPKLARAVVRSVGNQIAA